MLRGAVAEQTVGNPAALRTDVGPVIDAEAQAHIEQHVKAMQERGRRVERLGRRDDRALAAGTFVLPTVIEIKAISELKREVFGPVLHVLRYPAAELPQLVAQINATGYGLTMGLHTRIDETIHKVVDAARVGNVYVNRNIVGAVVGVQPFGGEGLSGTGPKAGGPLYMYRLLADGARDVIARALPAALPDAKGRAPAADSAALTALLAWLRAHQPEALATRCVQLARRARIGREWTLIGPTGERNVYALRPREAALCLADSDEALLYQLTGALAMGARVVWPADERTRALRASLPLDVQEPIALASDWRAAGVDFDVALFQGGRERMLAAAAALARHPGLVVNLRRFDAHAGAAPLEALLVEQSVSTNTAAAGGNASLMTIG
jgi:RHH-type proline utilization regulon transcriptional repressor/proline dehydrogenase/delta 1-pyrroline-5-carboxylate dehydrogenase